MCSSRFSYGDLLFDDSHYLIKKLVQKQNLTCESMIEKTYFNNDERRLNKLKNICIHCGELGGKGFLLCTSELREHCLTGEYTCLPICVEYVDSGEKVETKGKKNLQEERKEKEQKANMKKKSAGSQNQKNFFLTYAGVEIKYPPTSKD